MVIVVPPWTAVPNADVDQGEPGSEPPGGLGDNRPARPGPNQLVGDRDDA